MSHAGQGTILPAKPLGEGHCPAALRRLVLPVPWRIPGQAELPMPTTPLLSHAVPSHICCFHFPFPGWTNARSLSCSSSKQGRQGTMWVRVGRGMRARDTLKWRVGNTGPCAQGAVGGGFGLCLHLLVRGCAAEGTWLCQITQGFPSHIPLGQIWGSGLGPRTLAGAAEVAWLCHMV